MADRREGHEKGRHWDGSERGVAPHRVHVEDSGLLRRPLPLTASFSIAPGSDGVADEASAGLVFGWWTC